ncbi:hypothetical protein [Saprospira grandis]|nr:hypothetical protein [Saprospira grandis]
MRKSPEIGSGHHTTYFRELDGRMGRWWSADPVIHAGMSPYSAFDGNPIYYVDPLGADSGCPDCSEEEIEHREANGQVWDEEYGGWTERAAIKKGKAGKHAKKRAAFIKYMRSIGYTQADVNTYLKLKKKGNNPIVNNIESRIAEGRYEPIYDPNSPYADKWRASWNSGIYSSDYGRGVSSVVGTMGTVAVVVGPGLAIAASGMSANVAREIADEVADQAVEYATGYSLPPTSFTDLAQSGTKKIIKLGTKTGASPRQAHSALQLDDEVFDLIYKGRDNPILTATLRPGLARNRPITSEKFKHYTWQEISIHPKQFSLIQSAARKSVLRPPYYNMFGLLGGKNCTTYCIDLMNKGGMNIPKTFYIKPPHGTRSPYGLRDFFDKTVK